MPRATLSCVCVLRLCSMLLTHHIVLTFALKQSWHIDAGRSHNMAMLFVLSSPIQQSCRVQGGFAADSVSQRWQFESDLRGLWLNVADSRSVLAVAVPRRVHR